MGTRITSRRLCYNTEVKNYANGIVTDYDDYINVVHSRVGADDPKYKDKIRRGVGAANTLDAYKQRVVWKKGTIYFTRKNVGSGFTSRCRSPSAIPPGMPAGLYADAKNKAAIGIRQKINTETTTVSGGVILGEIRQTLHMIRHPAEAIQQLLTKVIKDHDQGLKRAQKLRILNAKRKVRDRVPIPGYVVKNGILRASADTVAKSYLELVFGLEPLMSDIASIAEAALSKYSTPSIKRISYTAQAQSATSIYEDYLVTGSPARCPCYTDSTDEVSCRYVVGYRVTVSGISEGLSRVIDQSGFNLRELAPTAWNLLPWSFLIDYASNIGDVIAANCVSLENVAWSYLVSRRSAVKRTSIQCSKAYLAPGDTFYYKDVYGTDYLSSSSIVEVKREAASIPFGELRFSLPEKESQFKNMAALLWSQLKH